MRKLTKVLLMVFLASTTSPASADAFSKLFLERQALIEVFGLEHVNDCVRFDEERLQAGLESCNKAVRETAAVINAGNPQARSGLLGALAME